MPKIAQITNQNNTTTIDLPDHSEVLNDGDKLIIHSDHIQIIRNLANHLTISGIKSEVLNHLEDFTTYPDKPNKVTPDWNLIDKDQIKFKIPSVDQELTGRLLRINNYWWTITDVNGSNLVPSFKTNFPCSQLTNTILTDNNIKVIELIKEEKDGSI